MDRNIRILDISHPLHAYQFALFLLRLRLRDQEFIDTKFRPHQEKLCADLVAGTYKKWARSHLNYPKPTPNASGSTKLTESTQTTTLPPVPEEDQREHEDRGSSDATAFTAGGSKIGRAHV